MKYACIPRAGAIIVREKKTPPVEPGKLLVRVARAGICAATELHLLRGETGEPFPIDSFNSCFGHEGAGVVEEAGPGVAGFDAADRIAYLGPCYAEVALVDPALAVKLPPDVSFDDILGEPFAVVLNTLDHVKSQASTDVVLLGAGFMGLLILQGLARMPLRNVIVADINNAKLRIAQDFGASATVNPLEGDLKDTVHALTDGLGADTVIEASGSPDALNRCGSLTAPGGRIVLHGFYPGSPSIDLTTWHVKELTIINSHPCNAKRYQDLIQRAVIAAQQKSFDLSRIVTHRFSLKNLPRAFEAIVKDPKLVKAVVDFDLEES